MTRTGNIACTRSCSRGRRRASCRESCTTGPTTGAFSCRTTVSRPCRYTRNAATMLLQESCLYNRVSSKTYVSATCRFKSWYLLYSPMYSYRFTVVGSVVVSSCTRVDSVLMITELAWLVLLYLVRSGGVAGTDAAIACLLGHPQSHLSLLQFFSDRRTLSWLLAPGTQQHKHARTPHFSWE